MSIEDSREELEELKQQVEELRSAVEGAGLPKPSSRPRAAIVDPGGIYDPRIVRDEDLEQVVQETIKETGATSGKQMGIVIKTVRGKLRGKRYKEEELKNSVRAHLSGKAR